MVLETHPYGILLFYNDCLEYRHVREGLVCESIAIPQEAINILYKSFSTGRSHKEMLDYRLISLSPSLVYYSAAFTRDVTITIDKKETVYQNVSFPPMVLSFNGSRLSVYAVKTPCREKLQLTDLLYQYPLPNIYSGGNLCYGAANSFDVSKYRTSQIFDLAMETLFGVSFSTEVHNAYMFNDLVDIYTKPLPKGKKQYEWLVPSVSPMNLSDLI